MRDPLKRAALVVAMVGFGAAVYIGLGAIRGGSQPVQQPTDTNAAWAPGTIYVAQAGEIYSLHGGKFQQLTRQQGGWTQPAVSADGTRVIAVRRSLDYSDLYLLDTSGNVVSRVTQNDNATVELNHWAFYPAFGADGQTVFYSYDPKDPYNDYRVDLAVYSRSLSQSIGRPQQWSRPNFYTGGDADPRPLRSGGLVYTKYSIDDSGVVHSQIWLQGRPGSAGTALTAAGDDCAQPALSPDQAAVAMVCRHGNPAGSLELASFDSSGLALGTAKVLVADRDVASPVFSPDGSAIAFFAPTSAAGPFQLWSISPTRQEPPSQLTFNLDLDTSAPPAWTGQ